jgi:hypothetical protein
MTRELETIVSDIINGTDVERIQALDAYGEQFKMVISAASTAVVVGDPMFVADRVMRLAHVVQRSFRPVFDGATDPEVKFLSALVLLMFGSRESLPWLLTVASTPGPQQYDVTYQLGSLRVAEVRPAILEQLRSAPLRETGTIKDGDKLSALLDMWKRVTDEPLPDDVLTRLRGDDAPLYVKAALKSLGWG